MKPALVVVDLLGPGDESVLENVDPDVFDFEVEPSLAREFLDDARHHIAVARQGACVIGMASALHYVHPDKPAQLFINEVGVAATHNGQGIGRRLVETLLDRGRELGCSEAWVATEPGNSRARRLYAGVGGVEDPEPFVVYTIPLGSRPKTRETTELARD